MTPHISPGATVTAGGTITHKLYSDATCSTEIDDLTPAVNTVVNGVAPDSDSHTFNTAGTFYFWSAPTHRSPRASLSAAGLRRRVSWV